MNNAQLIGSTTTGNAAIDTGSLTPLPRRRPNLTLSATGTSLIGAPASALATIFKIFQEEHWGVEASQIIGSL